MKNFLKSISRSLGYEVRRLPRATLGSNCFFAGEPFMTQRMLLEMAGRQNPVIFDVGAHYGESAVRYRSLFPNSVIYCFEPFSDSLRILEQKFHADPRVRIMPQAVADGSGNRSFFVNGMDATNSLLPRPSSMRRYFPATASTKMQTQVRTVSIDDLIAQRTVLAPDLLKMDIQGGELMALKGARETLSADKVALLYLEVMFVPHYEGGALFHRLAEFLEAYGYTLFDLYDLQRAGDGQIRYGDALFVSREIRSEVIDRQAQER